VALNGVQQDACAEATSDHTCGTCRARRWSYFGGVFPNAIWVQLTRKATVDAATPTDCASAHRDIGFGRRSSGTCVRRRSDFYASYSGPVRRGSYPAFARVVDLPNPTFIKIILRRAARTATASR